MSSRYRENFAQVIWRELPTRREDELRHWGGAACPPEETTGDKISSAEIGWTRWPMTKTFICCLSLAFVRANQTEWQSCNNVSSSCRLAPRNRLTFRCERTLKCFDAHYENIRKDYWLLGIEWISSFRSSKIKDHLNVLMPWSYHVLQRWWMEVINYRKWPVFASASIYSEQFLWAREFPLFSITDGVDTSWWVCAPTWTLNGGLNSLRTF